MLSIKINLSKLKGSALVNLKGKEETKKCLIIPVEESGLFVGEKGVYLNLSAFELKNNDYGQSHLVKLSVDRDEYNKLSDEEKNNLPILGGIKPFEAKQMQPKETIDLNSDHFPDDLPF